MDPNTFGYSQAMPIGAREVFASLAQDVCYLHEKWHLYWTLFGDDSFLAVLNSTDSAGFQLIEESLRNDMTMAFSRLCDPEQTCGKQNLSFSALLKALPPNPQLETHLNEFVTDCAPLLHFRNKQIGHNDLATILKPKDNPLPGIGKARIERLLSHAANLLNAALRTVEDAELYFGHSVMGAGRGLRDALSRAFKFEQAEIKKMFPGVP